MSFLDKIYEYIGEPECEVPPVDWAALEGRVGLRFPADYKAVVGRYPDFDFDSFLAVLNPGPFGWFTLESEAETILTGLREDRDRRNGIFPYPLHPEPGGLFPWAMTRDGDAFHWLTEGDPEQWRIVITNFFIYDETYEFPGPMSRYLADVLTGRFHCPVLRNRVPSPDPRSTQYGCEWDQDD